MKKSVLSAVLFGVFAFVVTSCNCSKKGETPVAEVIEEEVVVVDNVNNVEGDN